MAACRSVITLIPRRDCRTFTNTTFQNWKLKMFSAARYKIFMVAMILELQSVKLERDDT